MNITEKIAKQIGGNYKKIIEQNQEIQFYFNSYTGKYQWIDRRYEETSNIELNEQATHRKEFISIIKKNLKSEK